MIKLRRKKTTTENNLYTLFAGEFVKVTLKRNITETLSTPEGAVSQTSPLAITGYLLDVDDLHYYLGEDPNSVHAAIVISDVVMIQEVRMTDAADMLMDTADMSKVN